jgi:hypothetical protein
MRGMPGLIPRLNLNWGMGLIPGLILSLILAACAPLPRPAPPMTQWHTGRADPGYSNWLERQSVLGRASDLAAVVSGSPLGWRNAPHADEASTPELLREADVWLHVDPRRPRGRAAGSLLAELARPEFLLEASSAGGRGLFVAPAHPGGAYWHDSRPSDLPAEDAVSMLFAESVGTDEDFALLARAAGSMTPPVYLGGDILPAAPGRGPDFLLAAIRYRDYAGAWLMVEAPEPYLADLPPGARTLPPEDGALRRETAPFRRPFE